jgi:hypothetical protein
LGGAAPDPLGVGVVRSLDLFCANAQIEVCDLSISLAVDTAVDALEEAIARHGVLEFMNTDQGSQPSLNWPSQHSFGVQSVTLHKRPRQVYASLEPISHS